MTMRTWRRRDKCPACGSDNDCMSNVLKNDPAAPAPGAAAICISCGLISVIADNGKLRKPTDAERLLLAFDPKVQLVIRAQREVKKQRAH